MPYRKRRRKSPAFRGGEADSQYLQALIECNPLAIVVLRLDGSILDCNTAFEELFGYAQEEVVLQRLDRLIVPADQRDKAETRTTLLALSGTKSKLHFAVSGTSLTFNKFKMVRRFSRQSRPLSGGQGDRNKVSIRRLPRRFSLGHSGAILVDVLLS